jgi:hypothetical protein
MIGKKKTHCCTSSVPGNAVDNDQDGTGIPEIELVR